MKAIYVGGYFNSKEITIGDKTLTNKKIDGSTMDGMIIKLENAKNEIGYEVEWATSVGGEKDEEITCITETSDGGYIVGGYFKSTSITVGEKTLTNAGSTSYTDGMIIKYRDVENENGYEVEWVTSVGGEKNEEITCITETSDGGYIVAGDFYSGSITVGDKTLANKGSYDGMIIKYRDVENENGYEVDWVTSVGGGSYDKITCITATSDGGYIVAGDFSLGSITVGDKTLANKGSYDGMIIKYNQEGEVEWATSVGGDNDDEITCITATSDGGYIAGGYFKSKSITIGENILTNAGSEDGMIIKYKEEEVPNIVAKRATSVEGSSGDQITFITATSDGSYICRRIFLRKDNIR